MKSGAWLLIMLMVIPGFAGAQEKLGRLFFTPAERASLDRQRKLAGDLASRPAVKKEAVGPRTAAPPKMVTLNGIVRRSDGETTIWVNSQPMHEDFGEVEVSPGSITREGIAVQLPGIDRRVKLKVGQTVDATTGRIDETYQRASRDAAAAPVDESAAAPASTVTRAAARPRRSRLHDDDESLPVAPAREPASVPAETDGSQQEYQ
ncbi:MAG: hypothetical protein ABI794_00360 [Betaproteobacteria bacterium]